MSTVHVLACIVCLSAIGIDAGTTPKILILGAGGSGISFARTLLENNVDNFVILEAKDYIGGRVRKRTFAGKTINLGATWIHDISNENSLWKFKQSLTGFQTRLDDYANLTMRKENGQFVSTVNQLYSDMKLKMNEALARATNDLKAGLSDTPLRTTLNLVGWKPKSQEEYAIEYYFVDFENANPSEVLSGRQVSYTGSGTDHLVADSRGMSYLLEEMAKNFTSKIQLNTTVKNITYNSDKGVTVTTEGGTNFTADYALVTFSTGVLGSGSVKFNPALPTWKTDALKYHPMGEYTKIFIKFDSKFWSDSYYTMIASERRGYYNHLQNLDRDGFFQNEAVLQLTVTGPESKRVEKLSKQALKKEIIQVLKKAYPTSGVKESNILEIYCTTWALDPHFMGAYSSPVIGADEFSVSHLKARVGPLWFAGEATSSELFGYLHGALDSGANQAKAYLKCIQKNDCPPFKTRPKPTVCPSSAPIYLPIYLMLLANIIVATLALV